MKRCAEIDPWMVPGLLLMVLVCPAAGADRFLMIGGGSSPLNNQVSLERNVLFVQSLLAERSTTAPPQDVLFSCGRKQQRDLQFAGSEAVPAASRLLAQLFYNEKYLGLAYRRHQIANVRGGANREQIDRWFQETGAHLKAGDRLLIYVTAHGSKGTDKKKPHQTRLNLWDHDSIDVEHLVRQFHKLPPRVSVVLVMAQCYSGGFAHAIFEDGNLDQGLLDRDVCGFFSTLASRPAAGCTPDVNEANYQEFSSYFWAALGGRTRTGAPIDPPDYNGDGAVSLDEAHAYAVIASNTIDIPMKTSDAFLRAMSKPGRLHSAGLISTDPPYPRMLASASAVQRAVLEGLSAQLQLTGGDRVAEAKTGAEAIQQQRQKLADDKQQKQRRVDVLKKKICAALLSRWPEVGNLLNPRIGELLQDEAETFVRAAQSHPDYSEFTTLSQEIAAINAQRLELDRRWAKYERFRLTAESIALAANLPVVASSATEARYRQLTTAEAGTVFSPTAAPGAGPQAAIR